MNAPRPGFGRADDAGAATPCDRRPAPADRAGAPPTVHMWPGAPPAARGGLLVIGVASAPGGRRELAREQVRLALRQATARLAALTPDDITLHAQPGQAPRLTLRAANGARSQAGLSISHEDGLSLAAINLRGAVGIDLMRVPAAPLPDWREVARDYLGAATAAMLAGLAPEARARAFARAWTAREATLKCQGLPLREWAPSEAAGAARHHCFELALPAGLCGALAISI